MEPTAYRARLPKGFGDSASSEGLLDWSYVEERMASAMHYWLSTVNADGEPHTRPVAGMWLDTRLYFGGSPESRWLRNLAISPKACINLSEEGDQAVILHGAVSFERSDHELATRLVVASNAKYSYGQRVEEYEGEVILVFRPKTVFAWQDLKDATRWKL